MYRDTNALLDVVQDSYIRGATVPECLLPYKRFLCSFTFTKHIRQIKIVRIFMIGRIFCIKCSYLLLKY